MKHAVGTAVQQALSATRDTIVHLTLFVEAIVKIQTRRHSYRP